MTVNEPSRSSASGLKVPGMLRGSLLLAAVMLSGCASTTKLSWRDPSTPRDPAAHGTALADAGVHSPGRREGPTARPPAGATAPTADAGVVQTAAAADTEAPTPAEARDAKPAQADDDAGEPDGARLAQADDDAGAEASDLLPVPSGFDVPSIPATEREFPIDLTTALRLAEVENPRIAEARQRIGAALADRLAARVLLVPSLQFGGNYHGHTGNLQRSSGRILALDENSLYLGGGSGVMAASPAEIPAVSIIVQLTDAVFRPLAAQQEVESVRFDATTTANDTLLEVTQLYYELLAAEATLQVRLDVAEKETEVARLTRAYAEAQQGRAADANRAATELSLLMNEIRQAEEEVRVAAARLSHRLHLNQWVQVRPMTPRIEMTTIVDPSAPLHELVRAALTGRPEVGATTAGIVRAEIRKKQEQYRPLLPNIWLGFSGGVYGGGSNVIPPQLSHFGGRTDFDLRLYWTARNFGLGNIALVNQRQAEIGVAAGERAKAITMIRREVASAYAEVIAARVQVGITTRQRDSAVIGFREDLTRIQNTVGRPLEAVNSLTLLNHALIDRIIAVRDYNQAQFKLFVSLGSPPPLLDDSATEPIPPSPVAWPPLPPLVAGAAAVPSGAPSGRQPYPVFTSGTER